MTGGEIFARLRFYGVTLLGRGADEVDLMPLGSLLDQWECYKLFHGLKAKKSKGKTIDEVIPFYLA